MAKTFRISIAVNEVLSLPALWPDGDGPENPTISDVLELIENCGGAAYVLRDWDLDQFLTLEVTEGP